MGSGALCFGHKGNRRNSRKFPHHCRHTARALGPVAINRNEHQVGLLLPEIGENFVEGFAVQWIAESLCRCVYPRTLEWGKNRRDRRTISATLRIGRHVSSRIAGRWGIVPAPVR